MEEADLKTRTDAKQLINIAKEFKYRLRIIKGESGNLRGEFHKIADREPNSMLVLYNFKNGKKMKLKKQFKFPTQLQKVLRSYEEIKRMIIKNVLTQETLIEAMDLLKSWNTVEKQWIQRCNPNDKNFLKSLTDLLENSGELDNLEINEPIQLDEIEEPNELTFHTEKPHQQHVENERNKENVPEHICKGVQVDINPNKGERSLKRNSTSTVEEAKATNKKQRLNKSTDIIENFGITQPSENQGMVENSTTGLKDPRIPTSAPEERPKATQIRMIAEEYDYTFKISWGENYRPRGEFYKAGQEKPTAMLVFYNFLRSERLTLERQFKFPSRLQKLITTIPEIKKMIRSQALPPETLKDANTLDNVWKKVKSEWRKRHSPKGVDIILSIDQIRQFRRSQRLESDVQCETLTQKRVLFNLPIGNDRNATVEHIGILNLPNSNQNATSTNASAEVRSQDNSVVEVCDPKNRKNDLLAIACSENEIPGHIYRGEYGSAEESTELDELLSKGATDKNLSFECDDNLFNDENDLQTNGISLHTSPTNMAGTVETNNTGLSREEQPPENGVTTISLMNFEGEENYSQENYHYLTSKDEANVGFDKDTALHTPIASPNLCPTNQKFTMADNSEIRELEDVLEYFGKQNQSQEKSAVCRKDKSERDKTNQKA